MDPRALLEFDDMLLEEIEIPTWYTIPDRPKVWMVEHRYMAQVEATTEEEAFAKVAENPAEYLYLREE